MPPAIWTERERRTAFILLEVLRVSDQEAFDIMGRIFGEDWRAQFDRGERGKYKMSNIRDEVRSRWKNGRRQGHWHTIDPEGGPDAAERNNWLHTLGEIRTAAVDTTLRNFVLEDDNGNLTQPLTVINIPATLPPYQRDPQTFDSVFFSTRPRPAERTTAASIQASSSKAKTTTKTSKATTKKPTKAAAPPPPAPAPVESEDDKGWFLDMIHRNWLVDEQADELQVQAAWLEEDGRPKHIYQDQDVREFGGQVIRLYNPWENGSFDDMLVCQRNVCAWCTGTSIWDDACMGILIDGVDLSQSPTDGLPFIHYGRDVAPLPFGRARFGPVPKFHELNVPSDTRRRKVRCMAVGHDGNADWREVLALTCVQRRCGVCTPGVDDGLNDPPSPVEAETFEDDDNDNNNGEEDHGLDIVDSDDSKESDYERGPRKRPRRGDNRKQGGGRGRGGGRGGGSGGASARKPGMVVAGPD